jgi:hypothetical protein
VIYLLLKFSAPSDQPQPWPVIIGIDEPYGFPEIVSGRPDSTRFVGLASPATPTTCTIVGSELADPAKHHDALGLVPSYVSMLGDLFALPDIKLASISAYEVDDDAIARLREREAEYRRVLAS